MEKHISANSKNFKSSKTDLADISSTVTVDTKMSIVQKGTMFKSGDIIIKESNSGSLNTGDKLHFALDKQAMGFDVSTLKSKCNSRSKSSQLQEPTKTVPWN